MRRGEGERLDACAEGHASLQENVVFMTESRRSGMLQMTQVEAEGAVCCRKEIVLFLLCHEFCHLFVVTEEHSLPLYERNMPVCCVFENCVMCFFTYIDFLSIRDEAPFS